MRPTDQNVVIIGAGIVGTNLADELLSLGWRASNITVIEQGPLDMPGGSTSHAPGLVFQTNVSKTMTQFAKYTIDKLLSLEKDGQTCFNQVGGLEVATTLERLEELKRKAGYAASWGVDARVISAEECFRLYPHLNRDLVLGGLHIPKDGLALAARAVQLLIEKTRKAGVQYLGNTAVVGVEMSNNKVTGVKTSDGIIPADVTISCAGLWGVEVGKMVGLRIPLLPMGHQYGKTSALPELKEQSKDLRVANGAKLPILRYQDQDLYYREHGDRYGIGFYGHKPMPVSAATLGATPRQVSEKNMPSRMEFTKEDFAPAWKLSQEMLPILKQSQLEEGFNGIMSFTPDAGPLVGRAPHLDGFYVAEAVWVTHSAGVARALAQVLTTGKSEIDLAECELSRFEEIQTMPSYVTQTSSQNFVEVYDILHPYAQKVNPRNLRVSPFHVRQVEQGAYFMETRGWERPEWYEANSRLLRDMPSRWKPVERDEWSAQYYSPVIDAEAWKTRTGAGLFDLSAQTRLEVSGVGASELLDKLTTGNVAGTRVGSVAYALMLDDQGGIKSDVTIAKVKQDTFLVEANGPLDLAYLEIQATRQNKASPQRSVYVRDLTGGTCCVGLWGPKAKDVLTKICAADLTALPSYYVQRADVAGIPVTLIKARPMVGEAGWQIVSTCDLGLSLWDALWQAGQPSGMVAAGRGAYFSLRLESGFRLYGTDMTSEHSPWEAGLEYAICPGKKGFVGCEALQKKSRPTRRLRCLTVDDGTSMILGKEPVYVNGKTSGYVTSAAFGCTVRKPIALAWLPSSVEEGSSVEVDYFGKRLKATVEREPPYDRQQNLQRRASKL